MRFIKLRQIENDNMIYVNVDSIVWYERVSGHNVRPNSPISHLRLSDGRRLGVHNEVDDITSMIRAWYDDRHKR